MSARGWCRRARLWFTSVSISHSSQHSVSLNRYWAILLIGLSAPIAAADWQSVASLLQQRCVMCHSGDTAPLGLQLSDYESLMRGSVNGPVIVAGDPDGSPLIQRIRGTAQPQMPLAGSPLANKDIELITEWVAAGAKGPDAADMPAVAAPTDPYADGVVRYDEVAGIFGRHCVLCHADGGKYPSPPEGLRLTDYNTILRGGERVVVLPGNAAGSEIIRRVKGLAKPRMPFNGPPWLTDDEIALLAAWIDGGALSAEGEPAPIPVGGRVRLRGRLTAANAIDGAEFVTNNATRIKDLPPVGGMAKLRGYIDADGRIVAERLRSR